MKKLFLILALTTTYTAFTSDSDGESTTGGVAAAVEPTSPIEDLADAASGDEESVPAAVLVELSPTEQALEDLRLFIKANPTTQARQNIHRFESHEKSRAFTDAIKEFSNPEQTAKEASALAELCFKMGIVNAIEAGPPIVGFTSRSGDPLPMNSVTTLIGSCETPFAARALLAVGSKNFDAIGSEGKTVLLKTCCRTTLDLQAALLINELCDNGAVTITTTLRGNTSFNLINTRLDGALEEAADLEPQTRGLLARAARLMRPTRRHRTSKKKPAQPKMAPTTWTVSGFLGGTVKLVGNATVAAVQYVKGGTQMKIEDNDNL